MQAHDAALHVLVLGGGYGGVEILKKLEKRREVALTLVDPKVGIFHSIAAPRALVDQQYAQMAPVIVPYANLFEHVQHVQSSALEVDFDRKMVYVTGGRLIPYDVLVIATGRTYAPPFRLATRPEGTETPDLLAQLNAQRERLTAAPIAIIVGGGATGIETAAEIKAAYPNKTVRLVHSKPRLLNTEPSVSQTKAEYAAVALRSLGVQVELDQKFVADSAPDDAFVLWTGQSKPNTTFLPKDILDDEGLVRTDGTLQVIGKPCVYAIGDVVSGYAPNLKVAIMQHAPVIVRNIFSISKKKLPITHVKSLPRSLRKRLIVAMGPNHPPITGGCLFGAMMGGQKRRHFLVDQQLRDWTK